MTSECLAVIVGRLGVKETVLSPVLEVFVAKQKCSLSMGQDLNSVFCIALHPPFEQLWPDYENKSLSNRLSLTLVVLTYFEGISRKISLILTQMQKK